MLVISESRSIINESYKALIKKSIILEGGYKLKRTRPIDFIFPPGFDIDAYHRMPYSANAHNQCIEYQEKRYINFQCPGFLFFLGHEQNHYQGNHLFFAHSITKSGCLSAPDYADIYHHPGIFGFESLTSFLNQLTNTVIPMFFPSRISPWLQWSQYLYPLAKLVSIRGRDFCSQVTFLVPPSCPNKLLDELMTITKGADVLKAIPGRGYIISNIGGFSGSCLVSTDLAQVYDVVRND